MRHLTMPLLLAGVLAGAGPVLAQMSQPVSTDVVQFSASAVLDVRQDELTVTLAVTREGDHAREVQSQLQAELDAALSRARAAALPEAMEVRSGSFSLQPRYARDGRISGWRGSAELVLWGHDVERIAAMAGDLEGMRVTRMIFGLSRGQREQVETQAQALAIARFRARAQEIVRAFGFGSYRLREVHLSTQEQGVAPMPRFMARESGVGVAEQAPLPVEAGKSSVQVTVRGSVQMLP